MWIPSAVFFMFKNSRKEGVKSNTNTFKTFNIWIKFFSCQVTIIWFYEWLRQSLQFKNNGFLAVESDPTAKYCKANKSYFCELLFFQLCNFVERKKKRILVLVLRNFYSILFCHFSKLHFKWNDCCVVSNKKLKAEEKNIANFSGIWFTACDYFGTVFP